MADNAGKFLNIPSEKSKGLYQSAIRFCSGTEQLAASLTLFSSFGDNELNNKTIGLLHPDEIKTGNGFASDIRRRSFLHGRIAAKMAVNQLFQDSHPADLLISTGNLGAPLLQNLHLPYGISIAHDDFWNAGICFPLSVPMGVDFETIAEKNRAIIPSILSGHEKEMCNHAMDSPGFLHLLWTAKEAAGKAIGLGFRVPAEWYEIEFIEPLRTEQKPIYQCCFKNLPVFTTLSVEIAGGMLSIAFPVEKNLHQTMIRLLQHFLR
jgi:4'-phosphopantetheinyl transferase